MTPNLVGATIIVIVIVVFFLLCRLQQRPKEAIRWPVLLQKEIEDDAPPQPQPQAPNQIKFYYV